MIGDSFTLISELCPGGFELVSSPNVHCRCKESVAEVLNCEDDQDSIIIQVEMVMFTRIDRLLCCDDD